MASTPVIVTTWLDPPLQSDFQRGTAVTWHATFVDRISRALIDPDTVAFSYTNPPVTTSPVTVTTTKDAVGKYRADLPLNALGSWLLNVAATSSGTALGNASLAVHVFGAS